MQQEILKRVELLKTAILLEDEEVLSLGVAKLQGTTVDESIEAIVELIENKSYADALGDIEALLQRYSGVVLYEDKELQALKLELKALERELTELEGQKDEYLKTLYEFEVAYHQKLGDIISKILQAKQQMLQQEAQKLKEVFEGKKEEYQKLKSHYDELKERLKKLEEKLEGMDEFDDAYDEVYEAYLALKRELEALEPSLNQKRQEAKEAKKAYEEDSATKAFEEIKEEFESFKEQNREMAKEQRLEISEEEKRELKKLYREASRLCHPDIVADELKPQAEEMFKKLNIAYKRQDINEVKKILLSLQSGLFAIASDSIDDKEYIKEKIESLKEVISHTKEEINKIETSEVFTVLKEYDSVDAYLEEIKNELEREYEEIGMIGGVDENSY